MKFLSKSAALIVAISLFASCSSSDNDTLDGDNSNNNQIRVGSAVSLLKSDLQNTQIVKDQVVGFRVTDPTAGTTLYPNVQLTADGAGLFTYGTTMYYPSNGNNVNFYAYQPHSTDVDLAANTTIAFSTVADQTLQANYLKSDLLYSSKTAVARTNSVVPLTFTHKLSKLSFTVTKGTGIDIKDLSKIEVLNVLPSVDMELLTGTLSTAKGTATTVSAFNVKGGATGVASLTGSSAIVAPQTITAGTSFLRITIDNVTFLYKPEADITLDGGKNYSFNITVNMGTIEVSSTITDWADGGTSTGTGTME